MCSNSILTRVADWKRSAAPMPIHPHSVWKSPVRIIHSVNKHRWVSRSPMVTSHWALWPDKTMVSNSFARRETLPTRSCFTFAHRVRTAHFPSACLLACPVSAHGRHALDILLQATIRTIRAATSTFASNRATNKAIRSAARSTCNAQSKEASNVRTNTHTARMADHWKTVCSYHARVR